MMGTAGAARGGARAGPAEAPGGSHRAPLLKGSYTILYYNIL